MLLISGKKQNRPLLTGLGWSRFSPKIRLLRRDAETRRGRFHSIRQWAGPARDPPVGGTSLPRCQPAGYPLPRIKVTREGARRSSGGSAADHRRRSGGRPWQPRDWGGVPHCVMSEDGGHGHGEVGGGDASVLAQRARHRWTRMESTTLAMVQRKGGTER